LKADSPYKTFNDLMTVVKKTPGAVKFAGFVKSPDLSF